MKEFRRMKKRLFNSKGMTTIEIAISAMIILIGLAGFFDMVNMSQKLDTASSVTGYVGRVVAAQGGVRELPTAQHKGYYVGTNQLYREVKATLAGGGIAEKSFSLRINGNEIKPGTNLQVYTLGERMSIDLTIKYKWSFISGILGSDIESEQSSKKSVVSSFKKRDGDIQSTTDIK